MSTHLFVYGHGAGDPGAVGDGTNERDFNRKVMHPYFKKWADKLKNNKIIFWDVSGNKDLFQDTAKGWGIYSMSNKQYASITEFHLDAASASATGGHGIIYKTYSPDTEDKNVVLPIRDYIGWWGSVKNTQGINRRDNLLNCNVAAQRSINYRLIEQAFITNKNDMVNLRKNIDVFAKSIVEAVTGEKIGSGGNVSMANTDKRTPHHVLVGWYSKTSPGLKKLQDWLKKEKMGYTLKVDPSNKNRVWVSIGRFSQSSSWKRSLEKYLDDNRWSYVVCFAGQEDVIIKKWK